MTRMTFAFRTACLGFMLLLAGSAPAFADLSEVIERIKPAVVAVGTYNKTNNPQFNYRGTGFVVSDGRTVATNAHVLPEILDQDKGTTIVAIQYRNGSGEQQLREATLLTKDSEHDLALLTITGDALPKMALRNSDAVREGQTVAFTGFPIGGALGFSAVTHRGLVSSITPIALPSPNSQHLNARLIRRLKTGSFNIFQLDATAYPGSSGSPVFDPESGEVLGIINMVFIKGSRESALSQPSGISYALPARLLQNLMQSVGK